MRKIVADWSLTKIEDTNFDLIKPYLAGKSVLEVGCGRGYMTALISKMASVAAFDISSSTLRYAKVLGNLDTNVFYFQGNVYSIPFETGLFDVIVATEVLEHLPDLDSAMKEINRVLKKGGIVIASVPNTMRFYYPTVILPLLTRKEGRRRLAGFMTREVDDTIGQYHRPFMPKQFRNLFKENGFEKIRHKTSMVYFWRFPYYSAILFCEERFPSITQRLVKLLIRSTDVFLDNEFPLIKWFGIRQHLLARKVR